MEGKNNQITLPGKENAGFTLKELGLTKTQASMLRLLLKHTGKILRYSQIEQNINVRLVDKEGGLTRTADNKIYTIRKAIEKINNKNGLDYELLNLHQLGLCLVRSLDTDRHIRQPAISTLTIEEVPPAVKDLFNLFNLNHNVRITKDTLLKYASEFENTNNQKIKDINRALEGRITRLNQALLSKGYKVVNVRNGYVLLKSSDIENITIRKSAITKYPKRVSRKKHNPK